jgi:uncharacterized protein YbjT (DUF2867 family)
METGTQRVLVAGSTGYIGGYVISEFKKRGHFVRALARAPQKLDHIKNDIDEIVQGEVTDPESITNICDGIDVVFSSVGITKQKSKLTFKDVDYQGNVNLLEAAKKAGVKQFIYVSVFDGPNLLHLDIVKAHEDFVDVLKASGMDYAVIRPTGYFSDMGEFLSMAKKGRVYLVGSGDKKMNPIHGADLALSCVDSLGAEKLELDVGGPETLTYRAIAELAFKALNKPAKISTVPLWLMDFSVKAMTLLNKHTGGLLAFFAAMMTSDVVAPQLGTHTLEEEFKTKLEV